MTLPVWMSRALVATGVMNLGAAAAFLPAASGLRAMTGFPEPGHPLYILTAGLFVLLFGLAYLWTGLTAHADPLFVTMAAAGKLAFVTLVTVLWLGDSLPARAAIAASADLVFGVLFLVWLLGPR